MKPLVVAIALVSAAAGVCADTIDRVLAVVAGQPITLSDLNARATRHHPSAEQRRSDGRCSPNRRPRAHA
jgi:hypothetical protein